MPFADFLADLGQVKRGGSGMLGLVGETLGGKTRQQRGVEAFNQELPKIYEALDGATTKQEIEQAGRLLAQAWSKAGGPIDDAFDKYADRLIKPALNRVQQADLDLIRQDYGPKTTPLTPQVAPEGQGQPFDLGTTTFAPQTTPARNPMADPEGAFRMFQATGAKPEHLENIFKTPSAIAKQETEGRQKEYELGQQRRLENIQLPGSAGEAGMTAGMLAAGGAPVASYFTGLNPPRPDPLAEKRSDVMDAQIRNLNRLASQPPGGVQRERSYRVPLGDRVEIYDSDTHQLIRTIPMGQAPGSETVADAPLSPEDTELALRAIVREARRTGKTTPADLKAIAAQRNLVLEGEPTIETTGIYGLREHALGGPGVVLKRAPKVTTKGPPGKAPGGQPPAGGAPGAPKVGTIMQGYRFKGGDPANRANWEPVR